MAFIEIPHPEEPAQRASRRTHDVDPAGSPIATDIGIAVTRPGLTVADLRRRVALCRGGYGKRKGGAMSQTEQGVKAELFRAMHQGPGLLLLPNAWDAISARIIVAAGFSAIATTSGGVAWALGYPDGEAAPWEGVVAATAPIARSLSAPVTADIETGYGDTPDAVGRSIGDIIRAGAVGVNLEDGLRPAHTRP